MTEAPATEYGLTEALTLAARFVVPPFSVLDTRQGYWQDRREQWRALGIRSELGRKGDATGQAIASQRQRAYRAADGYDAERFREEFDPDKGGYEGGTSIFDPVLCELAYRWFSRAGDRVLDPFAGGSVRGVVAAVLGRRYEGCDLSVEQCAANEAQARELELDPPPRWFAGDSGELVPALGLEAYDYAFTCPPYYDLEVYSEHPSDLSNAASYDEFLDAYRSILMSTADALARDRFACIVVGEIRDKAGHYRGLVGDTIAAMADAGLRYYNHGILVNSVGSLPIRSNLHFNAGRKLGKCHQDVLVFCKGDARRATERLGPVDVAGIPLPKLQLELEVDDDDDSF